MVKRRLRIRALVLLAAPTAIVACSLFGPLPDVAPELTDGAATPDALAPPPDARTEATADVVNDQASGGDAVFAYTGGVQTFIVPNGVTSVAVKLWGGAGGALGSEYRGGHGAFVFHPAIAVVPGEMLTVIVGGGGGARSEGPGGSPTLTNADGGFGGGGAGTVAAPPNPRYLWGAGGGGRSALIRGADEILTAGGGGGVGYPTSGTTGNGGIACANADGSGGNGEGPGAGQGATLAAGGQGGTGATTPGNPGTALKGGDGLEGGSKASGGGGGGTYGGGSGAHTINAVSGAGGGGSCSTSDGGMIDPAGGVSDPDWLAPAGRGRTGAAIDGGFEGTGANGRVVIRWK